jgi:NADH:ubiquinone oxidoreductase subunit K
MVLEYWHLAVVAALLALIGWGLRAARQTTLVVLAVTLLLISAFLLYTLVLEETHLESDLNAQVDAILIIATPALAGVALATLAIVRRRQRS